MSGDGRRVDPQVLAAAAKVVSETPADQLGTPMTELESLTLSSADFGRAHGQFFQGFKSGVEQVAKSVESYVQASGSYAGALTSGGSTYTSGEEQAAEDARDAGRMP